MGLYFPQLPKEGVPRSEAPWGQLTGPHCSMRSHCKLSSYWQGGGGCRALQSCGHGPRLGCPRTAQPPLPPALLWVPPAGPQPGGHQPGDNRPGNNQPGNNQPGNNWKPDNNSPGNNQQPDNPEPKWDQRRAGAGCARGAAGGRGGSSAHLQERARGGLSVSVHSVPQPW